MRIFRINYYFNIINHIWEELEIILVVLPALKNPYKVNQLMVLLIVV